MRDTYIKEYDSILFMQLNSNHFGKIKEIFEEILKEEGYGDFSEICGDQTEDFCKEVLKKLDDFYANV